MEVKGVGRGEGKVVAQGETAAGVRGELRLNALPDRGTGGLEGERLSVESG